MSIHPNRAALGAHLRRRRESKGDLWTQQFVAHLLGVPVMTVSKMERGADGGFAILLAMMDLYQVTWAAEPFDALPDGDADSPRIIERKKKG